MTSSIKERLRGGDIVTVVNVGGANPDAVEMLARYGADIAFIDCEHSGIGLDAASHCIRAARASGIATVVRSWSRDPSVLVQYFDRKADGIVLPHVETAAEAEALIEAARYACGSASADKLLVVQIESRRGAEAVDEIGAVEGIDAVLIGPSDLTWDLSRSRDVEAPETQTVIDHVCARLRAAGKPFGMPVPLGGIDRFRTRGGTFLYHPLEWLVRDALAGLRQRLDR